MIYDPYRYSQELSHSTLFSSGEFAFQFIAISTTLVSSKSPNLIKIISSPQEPSYKNE